MKKYFITAVFSTLLILLLSVQSFAIPAFSRKYKTSCVTCHSVFPRLNSFGEAFRINGYQFPTDDDDKIKEEKIPLGADAYKKVFPNAVWPNYISAVPPIALRGRTGFALETVDEATTSQFDMPALQLLSGGSIGSGITLYAGAHLFEAGKAGTIDGFFVRFNNIFHQVIPEELINIKVGQFIPEIVPFASNHRGLTNVAYAFNTYDPVMGKAFVVGHVHGSGPFGIESFQIGAEASGIIARRFRYVAGVVNGGGVGEDINSSRDLYGRLAYKIGGMALDGSLKEGAPTDKEMAVTVGGFGYYGTGTNATTTEDFNFTRLGGDVNVNLNKLNFTGGYILGKNGNSFQEKGAYDLYFAETSYLFYPWLVGLLRYEQANPVDVPAFRRIVPHISALVVANVKLKLETRIDPDHLMFDNMYLGVDFAF